MFENILELASEHKNEQLICKTKSRICINKACLHVTVEVARMWVTQNRIFLPFWGFKGVLDI